MDPAGGHTWPGQQVEGESETCVADEQASSLPGQQTCGAGAGRYTHWGMDLVWDFVRGYRLSLNPANRAATP